MSTSLSECAKVPSQLAIFQNMLAQDDNFVSTLIPKSKIARFLDEGLKIQELQRQLKRLTEKQNEHSLSSLEKEIAGHSKKLQERILSFRQQQKNIMSGIGNKVAIQAAQSPGTAVEDELLYLPSDLTANERMTLDFISLALRDRKSRNDRKQKENTRSGAQIAEALRRRDLHMATYDAARKAMIALGSLDPHSKTHFPVLTEADLYMKSVQQKRHVGDSRRPDGLLWQAAKLMPQDTMSAGPSSTTAVNYVPGPTPIVGTQMDKRKSGKWFFVLLDGTPRAAKSTKVSLADSGEEPDRPSGWLWQMGKMGNLNKDEMHEWFIEGDRVQWFRAEAEMQPWQEQIEQKLAELLRTIRSFRTMQSVWTRLADTQPSDQIGSIAYAKQKAAMYLKRAFDAQKLVVAAGYGDLLAESANLIDFVEAQRKKEEEFIRDTIFIDDSDE
ncbi:hypothetical protein C8R44DRAFT_736983 [Mycena epipterygia]|nr:hypothetical protein C8R44DRAFT_736983 [Mycena epipterygia]